ncbi:BRLZ domain containing protein [Pyrenophora tritici-repentis]|nr:BRLZ domain containing protein [Pyrenophora tritici-repentis]
MPKKRSSSAANITNEDEKSQRKRVQNRISQRCSREKKLTQNRNIANFIELVKKAQTGSHENNKVLVNAYAELMQENDQLNEALLRMRKKLLSISNSSEAAASMWFFPSHANKWRGQFVTDVTQDDPIFEKLLEPKGNQRRQSINHSDQPRHGRTSTTTVLLQDAKKAPIDLSILIDGPRS